MGALMGAGVELGGVRRVARADKGLDLPTRTDGRDPRAVYARKALAEGASRISVAAKLSLSRKGLADLIERDDPVRMGPEDACHLVTFHLPEPFGPPVRDPADAEAWAQRDAFCDRLEDIASAQNPQVAAGLLHLADLHRHHATFYPEADIRASDYGVPMVPRQLLPSDVLGSPGAGYAI